MSEINYPENCDNCPNNPGNYEKLSNRVSISSEMDKVVKDFNDYLSNLVGRSTLYNIPVGKLIEFNKKYINEMGDNDALIPENQVINAAKARAKERYLNDIDCIEFNKKYIDEMGGKDET